MKAAVYNFKDHESGSTFDAKTFVMRSNFRAKDITDALIVMTLTLDKSTYTFSTTNGELEITDGAKGTFQLVTQVITLPSGRYKYDITFTFTNGDVKKYIKGYWKIL
jgi:hypothetical protein